MSSLTEKLTFDEVYELNISDKRVRKPGLPVLLPCALILWATCAGVYVACQGVEASFLLNLTYLSLGCSVLLAIATCLLSRKVVLGCILSAAIGATLGFFGAYQVTSASDWAVECGEQVWILEMAEDSSQSEFGGKATAVATNEDGQTCKLQVYFSEENNLFTTEKIRAKASAKSLSASSKSYSWTRGVAATISVSSYEKISLYPLTNAVIEARRSAIDNFSKFAGEDAGILQALVCGYRNTINESGEYDKYKICGLAHVVAVSGAHLAIVISVFMLFLKRFKLNRKLSIALSVCFVLAYLVFAGIPISAIRSAIMVILSLLAALAKRRTHPINALSLAIIGFIVLDPVSSVSVSLFLSAASTLGIMMFCSLITSWFEINNEKVNNWVGQPCALTLSSNIATLPFSVALFSQLSTIAIFANIVATPLFSLGCIVGLIAAVLSLFISPLASAFMFVASFCVAPLRIAVELISQVPYAAIALNADVIVMLSLSVALTIILWLKWPHLKRRGIVLICGILTCILAGTIFISPFLAKDEVIMLDVGQGDAILIRSEGKNVLVDTGNQETKLKQGLADVGVFTLDAVIITHSDDDHMGALKDLQSWMEVKSVYVASDALECRCKNCNELRNSASSIKSLHVEDNVKVGNFSASVIWPDKYNDEGGNCDSICLKLTSDINGDGNSEMTMLLTGDAESEQLTSMVKDKRIGDIDILKVGHHGSKVSLSDEVLDAIKPEVSLISCGKNNRYGHPKQETLNFLTTHNSKIYRTDESGRITVRPLSSGYEIFSQNE